MVKSDLRSINVSGGEGVEEFDSPIGRIMFGTDDLGGGALGGLPGVAYHSSAMAASVIVSVAW